MAYNRKEIENIKHRYPKGTEICLDSMENDPNPVLKGIKGKVICVDDIGTVHCAFDNGRQLGLIVGEDSFHIIQPEETQKIKNTDIEMNM